MLLALLVSLAAATPDAAPATTAAPPAAAAPAKPPQKAAADDVVCKTEAVTGSMFPKKICRKKSEMDAARLEEQAQIRASQKNVTGMQH
ncbi:hypothetical protein [Phenylobacterium sp.]|uniref:hypothetical protein n=1 Tax=Phenylobacterium sp. TaxID=1871053 RepID=UPI002DEE29EE|nr:hypothetical protein [Phenylobacterium sp.]